MTGLTLGLTLGLTGTNTSDSVSFPANAPVSPGYQVTGNAADGYSTTYSETSDIPATGTEFYVATTGNDSTGDGSSSTPYRTIEKARSEGGNTIRVSSGTYTTSQIPEDWAITTANLRLVAEDGPGTVIMGHFAESLSWSQEAGPNDDVYSVSIATTVNDVVDLTDTYAGETLKDGTTGTPVPLSEQTSVANCQANAGSFFYDSGTLYVHTHDSRAPDGDVLALLAKDIWAISNMTTATLYLDGIEFCGNDPLKVTANSSSNTAKVVCVDCGFRYSQGISCSVIDVATVRIIR